MKRVAVTLLLFVSFFKAKCQNLDSIYTFLNQTIQLSITDNFDVRSNWGIFFLKHPYNINKNVYERLKTKVSTSEEVGGFKKIPIGILKELYFKCSNIDSVWQDKFEWKQLNIKKFIIVSSYNKIGLAQVNSLKISILEKQKAIRDINEWNKSSKEDRLVNYASIPIFSSDGNYVLIVRGQNAGSSGWDSIFIYKKMADKWVILESVKLSTI